MGGRSQVSSHSSHPTCKHHAKKGILAASSGHMCLCIRLCEDFANSPLENEGTGTLAILQ